MRIICDYIYYNIIAYIFEKIYTLEKDLLKFIKNIKAFE